MDIFNSIYVKIKSEMMSTSSSLSGPRSGRIDSTPQSWRTSPLVEVEEATPISLQSESHPPNYKGKGRAIDTVQESSQYLQTPVDGQKGPSLTPNNTTGDEIPPPKPKVIGKVYRVRGIPEDYGDEETAIMLRRGLTLNESTKITIRSLAMSEYRGQKVSVVELKPEPSKFAGEDGQWSIHSEMDGRIMDLTMDTHFRGLTVLRSPSNHNLEYAHLIPAAKTSKMKLRIDLVFVLYRDLVAMGSDLSKRDQPKVVRGCGS